MKDVIRRLNYYAIPRRECCLQTEQERHVGGSEQRTSSEVQPDATEGNKNNQRTVLVLVVLELHGVRQNDLSKVVSP